MKILSKALKKQKPFYTREEEILIILRFLRRNESQRILYIEESYEAELAEYKAVNGFSIDLDAIDGDW
jgi:hypothetical protein